MERPRRGTTADGAGTSAVAILSPGAGKKHEFETFAKHKKHQCAYCPSKPKQTMAYTFCKTCVDEGQPCMAFCSFTTGRNCQDKHRRGHPAIHTMHVAQPKSTGKAPAKPRNKRGASAADLDSLRRSQRANCGSPSGARGT